MSPGRRTARRQAVFMLYQGDLLHLPPAQTLQRVDEAQLDSYARTLVSEVVNHQDAVDEVLKRHVVAGWSLERLGTLERSILRLAAYELLWEPEVPGPVIIDEAVELAKRFCSDEAGALVNGILGSLADSESTRIQEIRKSSRDGSKVAP